MDINLDTKYYRAIKDSFLWKEGAILAFDGEQGSDGGYKPIEDVWDNNPHNEDEYISRDIIESAIEWFQRVYPIKSNGGVSFLGKEQVKEAYKAEFEPIKIK